MNPSEKLAAPNPRADKFIAYWRSMLLSRAFNQIEPPRALKESFSTAPFLPDPPIFDLQNSSGRSQEWCTFGKDAFLDGSAPWPLTSAVFERLDLVVERKNQEIRRKNLRGGKYQQQEIDPLVANPVFRVEYAPCILRRRSDNRRFIPMFGVATVDRQGVLRGYSPGEASLPPPLWFRRLFMTPHDADVPLTIGDQKSYISWVGGWLLRTGGRYDWTNVLELFDGSWRAASGCSIIEWSEREGYAVEAGFIREGSTGEIMLNMHAAYGELRSAYRTSPGSFPLFSSLITGVPGPSWEGEGSYLGFLGDSWGLTTSQRMTAKAFTCTDEGRILAVNGPPGTGKTTLLRTVLADLVVRSAIEGRSAPFIVACGATNQSVTNILEAFAGASSRGTMTPLERRWVPFLSSYGSYSASSRLDLAGKSWKHQVLTVNPFNDFKSREHAPDQDELDLSLERLQSNGSDYSTAGVGDLLSVLMFGDSDPLQDWLRSYRSSLSAPANTHGEAIREVQTAVRSLAEDIRNYDRALDAYVSGVGEGAEIPEEQVHKAFSEAVSAMLMRLPLIETSVWIDRWKSAFERHRDQGLGEALAAAADVSLRLLAFHFASRYWEGRFLEAMKREKGLPGWTREVDAFRMLSMILPCTVSTLDRLPGLLKRGSRGMGKMPMWSEVDLLIVDEAGQAGPDKGALAFAYAKRALVVGDVRQLSPVSDEDSPFFSHEIGEENGVLDEDAKCRGLLCGEAFVSGTAKIGTSLLGDFTQSAVEASFGSIMRAASGCSSFSSGPNDAGMWLYDHFRCEPTIIDYCNRLWYGGRLIPRTALRVRQEGVAYLPPMSHLEVQGRNLRVGSSRTNPEEADRIVDWLVDNHDWLIDTFGNVGDGLDDVVAIVTPFASQDRVISDLLRARLSRQMGRRLRKLVHGTVHRMQGAERPVVIFSTVYSGDSFAGGRAPTYFFDREPRLLNVAVSRAKQAFLVVGDRRVFDQAPSGSPTAHLKTHLSFHESLPYLETPEEMQSRVRSGLSSVIDPLRAASDWK